MTSPTSSETCPETPAAFADLPCQNCDKGRALAAKGYCCRDFRAALGNFATGVTVLTAVAENGERIGVTISSFNSVSLDPPLVLWSLSNDSPNLESFRTATHYAVNVLAADQQEISNRFAASSGDRFSGVALRAGAHGAPLIDGCCATFECVNQIQYPGGDHLIFVGHVDHFAQDAEKSPLIFHGGSYRALQNTGK
jgi:flavin reductase (DIM6/NTAB) family NADH-FMN oxidoreductase RutF